MDDGGLNCRALCADPYARRGRERTLAKASHIDPWGELLAALLWLSTALPGLTRPAKVPPGTDCHLNPTTCGAAIIRPGEQELYLAAKLALGRTRLMMVLSSSSWRLTIPLWELSRFARSPKQQLRRYAVGIKNKATEHF